MMDVRDFRTKWSDRAMTGLIATLSWLLLDTYMTKTTHGSTAAVHYALPLDFVEIAVVVGCTYLGAGPLIRFLRDNTCFGLCFTTLALLPLVAEHRLYVDIVAFVHMFV